MEITGYSTNWHNIEGHRTAARDREPRAPTVSRYARDYSNPVEDLGWLYDRKDPDADHTYTLLMVMNAMGIAARAMNAGEPTACHPDMSDEDFKTWLRSAA